MFRNRNTPSSGINSSDSEKQKKGYRPVFSIGGMLVFTLVAAAAVFIGQQLLRSRDSEIAEFRGKYYRIVRGDSIDADSGSIQYDPDFLAKLERLESQMNRHQISYDHLRVSDDRVPELLEHARVAWATATNNAPQKSDAELIEDIRVTLQAANAVSKYDEPISAADVGIPENVMQRDDEE